MLLFKVLAGGSVGVAMLVGLQSTGVWSWSHYLKANRAHTAYARMTHKSGEHTVKAPVGETKGVAPKRADTTGQRPAADNAPPRMEPQSHTTSGAVPLPPRHPPGLPGR